MKIKQRQLEIINAAGELLTQSGVSGLTIKKLAAKMGFAESALYRHFSSKEEVIVTMLDYFADDLDGRFNSDKNKRKDPTDQLKAFYIDQITFFNENPHFLTAVLSDGLFEENEIINQAILRIMNIIRQHLLRVITEGQTAGLFSKNIEAGEWVHIIMGSFRLLMLQWRMSDFSFDLRKRGQQLIKSILSLIKIQKA